MLWGNFSSAVGVGSVTIWTRVSSCEDCQLRSLRMRYDCPTFRPTMMTLPSAAQQSVQPSPPSETVAVQFLLRTSQNLQVPSLETDVSSASLIGFHPTATIPPVCPRNSVLLVTFGLSGFHTRSVRSAEPVAIRVPVGFHAIERMLSSVSLKIVRKTSNYPLACKARNSETGGA